MYGGLSVWERLDLDFIRARRRARRARLFAWLGGDFRGVRPPSFEVLRGGAGFGGVRRLGLREVETAKIVGSVGRGRDFDAGFMPTSNRLRSAWMRVDQAFLQGEEFAPVSLYEVDGEYFVSDGNHRVSVARFHGVEFVAAEVTRLKTGETSTAPARRAQPQRHRDPAEEELRRGREAVGQNVGIPSRRGR